MPPKDHDAAFDDLLDLLAELVADALIDNTQEAQAATDLDDESEQRTS